MDHFQHVILEKASWSNLSSQDRNTKFLQIKSRVILELQKTPPGREKTKMPVDLQYTPGGKWCHSVTS